MSALMNRRGLLQASGALVVSFSMAGFVRAQEAAAPAVPEPPKLPGSLDDNRFLDAWIRIGADNSITVFTGKAELGQGIRTALLQVAAEELDVEPHDIALVTADTGRTPDEGFTAGSQSMQNSGTAIRNAAAQVREILLAEAARQLNQPVESLIVGSKSISASDGRSLAYGRLIPAQGMHVEASPQSKLKAPDALRVMGKPLQRVDIPGKVTGAVAYVHDLRLDGMLHARVVRPPSYGAQLQGIDDKAVRAMPGVVTIVQDGNFLAVVAEQEFQAIAAMRALSASARWQETPSLPNQFDLPKVLQQLERQVGTVAEAGTPDAKFEGQTFEATYTRPYQVHGSIGPSCAVAHMQGDQMTVWSHTQGVYPDREAIAELLSMPLDKVRIIHMEGAGCYGHNGADDAAADAALIARAVNGRPVRLQWMREQEHAWEPFGPAMLIKVRAALGQDGKIANWQYDLWSNTHSTRPGGAGALLAGQQKASGFTPQAPKMVITPSGNGDRNADPLYALLNKRVLWHFLPQMPLRVSALRALGAYANVFALESTIDELSYLAKVDPIEFRLRHMEDERARKVIETAAEKFGWAAGAELPPGRGRGFAFARYKNHAAYFALAVEVEVERDTGRIQVMRAVGAIDSGEIVNHDGIRNQTQGGIIQSTSWTLYEALTFNDRRITSIDWSSYPILRFPSVPEQIDVHIIERPGEPFLGTGEAAQGPTCAAIANALRNATGKRFYDLPFSRDKVKAAIAI
jgi:nicotinate dehydrogenase subunit B